jgi:hypothetical protein
VQQPIAQVPGYIPDQRRTQDKKEPAFAGSFGITMLKIWLLRSSLPPFLPVLRWSFFAALTFSLSYPNILVDEIERSGTASTCLLIPVNVLNSTVFVAEHRRIQSEVIHVQQDTPPTHQTN